MKHLVEPSREYLTQLIGRPKAVVGWCEVAITEFLKRDKRDLTIINIGCGYGWLEMAKTQRHWPVNIISLEPSFSDLLFFQKNLQETNALPLVATGLSLPLVSCSIDIAVVTEVLEHIPRGEEYALFAEVFRVMSDGGIALFTTPKRTFLSCIGDPAWWLIGHRHYSTKRLVDFAESAGFMVNLVSTHGGWAEMISMLDLYVSKWLFRRRPMLPKFYNRRLDIEWESSKRSFMGLWMVVEKKAAN
jgi:SAM-dependent methyltransferase